VFVQHSGNRSAILNPSSHECGCPTKDSKAITVYDGKGNICMLFKLLFSHSVFKECEKGSKLSSKNKEH